MHGVCVMVSVTCVYIMSDYGEKHIVMKEYYLNLVTYILLNIYKWNC